MTNLCVSFSIDDPLPPAAGFLTSYPQFIAVSAVFLKEMFYAAS